MNKNKQQKSGNKKAKAQKKVILKKVIMKPKKQRSGKSNKFGGALRVVGQTAGAFLGNPSLGRAAGSAISRIFGQGDYAVKSNSLTQGGPPAFAALNTGLRVSHREFIADVVSSTSFANTTYDINPTNSTTFPWLSRLAANFEEFSIKGLVFWFNTTCGSAISSTNNSLGTVGMTTVYDPSDPALASKRECEDYAGCVAGVPSSSLIHPLECKPRSNVLDRLYIQIAPVSDADELKFYSHGTLNLFTQGMQAAAITIGELWVSYDIEFFTPKILPIGTVDMAASRSYGSAATIGANTLLGSSQLTFSTYGNLKAYYDATGYFHIPKGTAPGYYMLTIGFTPTSGVAWSITPVVGGTNMTLVGWIQGSTGNNFQSSNGTTGVLAITVIVQKSDANDGSFRLGQTGGTLPTAPMTYDLVISKLPNSVISGVSGSGFQSILSKKAQLTTEDVEAIISKYMSGTQTAAKQLEYSDEEDICVVKPKKRF